MKIYINLFEKIFCCTLFPFTMCIIDTIVLVISIIQPQEKRVYCGIALVYIISLLILVLSLGIVYFIEKRCGKKMIINNGKIELDDTSYLIDDITSCVYYSCKWYLIPFLVLYKRQVGGLIEIKFVDNSSIKEKIFYKDYLKLKEVIKDIILK